MSTHDSTDSGMMSPELRVSFDELCLDFDAEENSVMKIELPKLKRHNAITPEKVVHNNLENMSKEQIMSQTKVAMNKAFFSCEEPVEELEY